MFSFHIPSFISSSNLQFLDLRHVFTTNIGVIIIFYILYDKLLGILCFKLYELHFLQKNYNLYFVITKSYVNATQTKADCSI